MRLLGWWTFFKVVFVLMLCLVVALAQVEVPLVGRKQFSILLSAFAGGKTSYYGIFYYALCKSIFVFKSIVKITTNLV
jgi:hypothetical protein